MSENHIITKNIGFGSQISYDNIDNNENLDINRVVSLSRKRAGSYGEAIDLRKDNKSNAINFGSSSGDLGDINNTSNCQITERSEAIDTKNNNKKENPFYSSMDRALLTVDNYYNDNSYINFSVDKNSLLGDNNNNFDEEVDNTLVNVDASEEVYYGEAIYYNGENENDFGEANDGSSLSDTSISDINDNKNISSPAGEGNEEKQVKK